MCGYWALQEFDTIIMSVSLCVEVNSNCDFKNWGSEKRECHDFDTHLKRTRDFTGNLSRT
jgi:hypothetical protein